MAKMSLKITITIAGRWYKFLLFDDDVCKTTNELKEFCFTRFPQLRNGKEMKIYWTDDDGDDICIMTDVDYGTFMREALSNGKASLCMECEEDPQVNASPPNPGLAEVVGRPTHHLVVCDVCDQEIVGHRYRCLSCHDYDLCMTCEAKYRHKDHVMLRIPRPTVGSRGHTGRMFEKMQYYAGKLDMIEMESGVTLAQTAAAAAAAATAAATEAYYENVDKRQKKASSNEHGKGKENSEKKKKERQRKCQRSQEVVNTTYEAAAAAAAMLAERAKQVRFGEVLHRYIDPANIQQASSESQPPSAAPSGAAAAAAATASDEAMNEARRSMKLATEAAKAASEAVAASWSTFRECAGTFVPVITSPLAGTATSAARGGQRQESTPTPSSSTPPNEEPTAPPTPPKASAFGLVDEVLKHTPPELKCFLPTDAEMQRMSESVSGILTQLGLELHIPSTSATETEPKPSTSSSPGEATTTSPVRDEPNKQQQQQQQEEVVVPASEVAKEQQQAAVAQEVKEKPTTNMEIDGVRAGPSSYSAKTSTSIEEHKEAVAMEKDDFATSDTSSASLLTDDDEDVVEAAETMGSAKATPPPPAAGQEVAWILVDIPDDVEEKEKPASTSSSRSSSSNDGSGADAPAAKDSTDKKKEEQEQENASSQDFVPPPEATPEQLYAYFHNKMINWHKQSMDQLNAGSSSKGQQQQGGESYKTAFEKAAKELEKHLREMQNDKEQQPKEQRKEQPIVDAAASVATPEPEKPNKGVEDVAAPSTKPSSADAPKPSTSTAQRAAAATASKKPAAASAPSPLYSPRPHVNHAIKTMMTMGFSNCDGHLTQLLEALDGDIPRALDMLMQNLP